MGTMEIVLIVAGIMIIVISFMLKDNSEEEHYNFSEREDVRSLAQDIVKEEVQNQLAMLSDDVLENTEAKLDKLANQKIMAVGNYSEDVLKNIEDNHNEVMFLYNMLNDKETTLKNTVRDIEAVKVSVKQMSEENKVQEPVKEEPKETPKKEKPAKEMKKVEQVIDDIVQRELQEETQEELPEETVSEMTKEQKKEIILKLYRQGRTNVEIAQELNLGVGEVNLVLGLFM